MTRHWHEYWMGFARHAATKSKDTTRVGAVLVGPERDVRLTGYNGPPIGVQDRPERRERPAKYLYSSHAEANLIAFAAREGISTKGCHVYTTHHPCSACARTLIQAGITKVVYETDIFGPNSAMVDELRAAREMFAEACVEFQQLVDMG